MTQQNEVLHVISTDSEIDELIKYLGDKKYVAYDCETTSLSLSAEIVGFSVCADIEEAYYIVTAVWDKDSKELIRLPTKDKIVELLTLLKSKQLITHNGLVDWQWTFRNYGVQLKDSTFHDTMLSGHLINENTSNALKDRAYVEFGEDSIKEQQEMRESVIANGGIWEQTFDRKKKVWKDKKKGNKEMYKADPFILGKYGAKDALLTLKLFYLDVPRLYEASLDKYFYEEESMPLFKGPTYDMNTVGIKVDVEQLKLLEQSLRKEIDELKASIITDITPYIKDLYPGTNKKNQFNIGSTKALAWLLHVKLGNRWKKVTDSGRDVAKALIGRIPYSDGDKRRFELAIETAKDEKGRPYKLQNYIKCDKYAIAAFADKYTWCKNLLKYAKAKKLLSTYVEGMYDKIEYGIIHPAFIQIGTKGTRYSSKNPNFQNLPRDDKRVKKCMIARPGKVFVGADASQIEARVFAYFSGDQGLMDCFNRGEDFYSVIGMKVFGKYDCTPYKEGSEDAFGIKYKNLRTSAKCIALAVCYGAEAPRLSDITGKSMQECQQIIDDYWDSYPTLKEMVNRSHKQIVDTGVCHSLFGRPRHLPEAITLQQMGWPDMDRIPEDLKTYLNMSVNQPIQMTAGNIVNRSGIAFKAKCKEENIEVDLICQVHDQWVAECDEKDGKRVAEIMQDCMENTISLPGIKLEAKPVIGLSLGDL